MFLKRGQILRITIMLCVNYEILQIFVYIGTNYGELIRPCRCIGPMEFIHVHCLETMANLNNTYYCTSCYYAFPIEQRNKPLIEVLCKMHESLLIIRKYMEWREKNIFPF